MKPSLALIAIIAVSIALSARAATLSGPITNTSNNHFYYLLSQGTWTASEAEAVSLGGHLATVSDQSEQDWIWSTFSMYGGNPRSLWIGLSDAQTEGNFEWVNGESLTYTHWTPGEPNDNLNEDYVHIFPPFDGQGRDGFWNDSANSATLANSYGIEAYGLVEVPEPSSTALLLLGPVYFYLRRKIQ